MKKTLSAIIVAIFAAGSLSAQERVTNLEQEWRWEQKRNLANRGFTNISYVTQKMIEPVTGLESGSSDWGVALTKGRTFTLHHRPVADMIYFGLDGVWTDVNYAQYKIEMGIGDFSISERLHQADLSLGIGPSVHLLPVEKLGIHAYFRYMPTVATFADDSFETIVGGYASMFTTGGAVSWSAISLGIEARWGTGKYKFWTGDDQEGGFSIAGKLKTSGMRAYVSLRF
jgi:hypothetical protein